MFAAVRNHRTVCYFVSGRLVSVYEMSTASETLKFAIEKHRAGDLVSACLMRLSLGAQNQATEGAQNQPF